MKNYEILALFSPQLSPDALERAKAVVQETVKKHGGSVTTQTDLGRKMLGYSVKKFKEANAVAFDLQLAENNVSAVNQALQISEDVLKFIFTIKAETKKEEAAKKLTPAAPAPAPRPAHAERK